MENNKFKTCASEKFKICDQLKLFGNKKEF